MGPTLPAATEAAGGGPGGGAPELPREPRPADQVALAGAPPADVSGAGAEREAPPGPGAGAEPDLGRAAQPAVPGRVLRPGVGERAGGVGVPAERGGPAGVMNDWVELTVTTESLDKAIEILKTRLPETLYQQAWRALTDERERRRQ